MLVRYNSLNRMEPPQFTLCNPGSVYKDGIVTNIVGMLVDHEAEEIVFNFNASSELNLRVNRAQRENPEDNGYAQNVYRAVQNRRLLFVDDIGYFMITGIEDGYDGGVHYKDVTAKSIDVEIAQKMLPYIANGTYRFTTDTTSTNKGILETIVEVLPLWTVEYVDEAVASKWRTFEDVDTSMNCLSFMLENLQDAFECIFLFNNITRTISVYDQANYVRRTSIHITKDDLINSLSVTENADDLYTAISVLGGDDVTISAVNPTGSNVIYDFSYYFDWMSDGLGQKVRAWQDAVEDAFDSYYETSLLYYQGLAKVSDLKQEIEMLDTQLKMYTRCRENIVAESGTTLTESYNAAIEESGGTPITICEEVADTLAGIDELIAQCESKKETANAALGNLTTELGGYRNSIEAVHNQLSMLSYFTEEEYGELCHYIFEGSYNDEYVTTTDSMTYREKFEQMKTLYDRSKTRLNSVSKPSQEFSVDVESFIFSKEFAHYSEQLETGCLINVELEVNDIAELFLSSMTVNYDDYSMSLTFGNRFNKFDPKSLYNDVLGKISKSSNTLDAIKEILYPIKSGGYDSLRVALETSRNLTMGAALAASNERVVIDGSGYTGRQILEDGTIDPCQVKITSNSIVFTSDAWKTCEVALGKLLLEDGTTTYGLNASTIFAHDIIMTGSFTAYTEAFMEPGEDEVQAIMKHYTGIETIASDRLALYDFDDDGEVTYSDAMLALQAARGSSSLSGWSGAQKSAVTMKINMKDPNNFVTITGTNMWGRTVSQKLGINLSTDMHPFLSSIYPVNSVYLNTSTDSPTNLFGGIWEELANTDLSGIHAWKRVI